MKRKNIKRDLEKELQKLRKRGATAISVFLAQGKQVSMKEYAKDIISFLKMMNKSNTGTSEAVLANKGL